MTAGRQQRVSLRHVIRVALVTSIALASALPARADKAKADALAAEASAAAAASDHRKAAQLFSAANKEDPRPNLFCNIGISYFKAEEWTRAHLLLNRCLDRTALEAGTVESVRAVIGSIEETMRAGQFAPVTINVADGTRVQLAEFGDDEVFTSTRTVWLAIGTHSASGQAVGFSDHTIEIRVEKTAPMSVELTLTKLDLILAPRTVRKAGPKLPAVIATGATVVVGIAAVVFNRKAHTLSEDARFTFDEEEFDSEASRVRTFNNLFLATASLAVIGAGISGFLWYRSTRLTEVPIEVTPTAGGAAVTFGGRF